METKVLYGSVDQARKPYGYVIMTVLLVLALSLSGCSSSQKADMPSVVDTEPAPSQGELPEKSIDSSESGDSNAVAFAGTDFLVGEEVKFELGQSARPAIISFFSPG